jgi:uncharacterized membrane protein
MPVHNLAHTTFVLYQRISAQLLLVSRMDYIMMILLFSLVLIVNIYDAFAATCLIYRQY